MGYRNIDMDSYPRRRHFDYFRSLMFPYVSVTSNVDITEFMAGVRERGYPFFLSFCYCVERAANAVPQFRQRIRGEGIVEYDWCRSSHTLALPDDTYCYCATDCRASFRDFLPLARAAQERAKRERSLDDGEDGQELLFFSSGPWTAHTALVMPVPYPADSNPRITWGKYFELNGCCLIPITVQVNHALVDGLHISRFHEALETELLALFR